MEIYIHSQYQRVLEKPVHKFYHQIIDFFQLEEQNVQCDSNNRCSVYMNNTLYAIQSIHSIFGACRDYH